MSHVARSPAKFGGSATHGSRVSITSPGTQKRDPATPSRTVRSSKTPPVTGLMRLPAVAPSSPPRDESVKQAAVASVVLEPSRGNSPVPHPPEAPRSKLVSDSVESGVEIVQSTPRRDSGSLGPAPRQSPSAEYEDDDFENSSDEGTSPERDSARGGDQSSKRAPQSAADQPERSVSPVLQPPNGHRSSITSATVAADSTGTGPIARDRDNTDGKERPKRKPSIQVNLGSRQLIGHGSFGNVYRAVDVLTNRLVAVKEIALVDDEVKDLKKQIHAIEREIRVMQKLDHPNIVKYLGARRHGTALYLYMEYVPGGTLSSFLSNFGTLTEDQAAQFTVQILQGLDYLHSKQIAHRDLKGENLFVDTNGGIKLGDFGTSKELRTLGLTQTVAGTPYFMAPEVINCTGHGVEADIWSVGCVVIQMLTGKPPFHNCDNGFAVMFQVAKGEMSNQIPKNISEQAKDFIRSCLRMNPSERPTTKDLLSHQWLRETQERLLSNQEAAQTTVVGSSASHTGPSDLPISNAPPPSNGSFSSVDKLRSRMPSKSVSSQPAPAPARVPPSKSPPPRETSVPSTLPTPAKQVAAGTMRAKASSPFPAAAATRATGTAK